MNTAAKDISRDVTARYSDSPLKAIHRLLNDESSSRISGADRDKIATKLWAVVEDAMGEVVDTIRDGLHTRTWF